MDNLEKPSAQKQFCSYIPYIMNKNQIFVTLGVLKFVLLERSSSIQPDKVQNGISAFVCWFCLHLLVSTVILTASWQRQLKVSRQEIQADFRDMSLRTWLESYRCFLRLREMCDFPDEQNVPIHWAKPPASSNSLLSGGYED